MIDFKKKLIDALIALAEEKAIKLKEEMRHLQSSSGEETKSSMGDKYETGRAMIMQEQQKVADQQDQVHSQLRLLSALDADRGVEEVQFGALVYTKQACYFISIPLGLVVVEGVNVFCVSANAPVSQAMLGKEQGEVFSLNGQNHTIVSIE